MQFSVGRLLSPRPTVPLSLGRCSSSELSCSQLRGCKRPSRAPAVLRSTAAGAGLQQTSAAGGGGGPPPPPPKQTSEENSGNDLWVALITALRQNFAAMMMVLGFLCAADLGLQSRIQDGILATRGASQLLTAGDFFKALKEATSPNADMQSPLAVKADIKELKDELKADIAEVRSELKANTWVSAASLITLVIIVVRGGGRAVPGGAGPPRQQGA